MCNTNSTTPPATPTPTPIPSTTTQTMKKKKRKKSKTQTKQKSNKNSSPSSNSSSSSSSSSLKPLKTRNRTKTRKPKYLSLRLQLSQTQTQTQTQNQPKKTTPQQPQQQQQNLFLNQPEPDNPEENNVALLFTSDGGATLNGLLEDESTTVTAATSDDLSAMTCPTMEGLVRKAMRRRSDEGSEERWVCYSEVVEERKEMVMEEVNSSGSATTSFGSLSLKLDHEGILNAWSDKGSLYVAAGDEGPQIVPDLLNHSFLHALPPNVGWDGYGCDVGGNLWKVPEDCGASGMSVKQEMDLKLGQREASVLRYKEKRQNRLFAKRIRYEVRKLNAEKRPRMKGRFVKRE